MWQMASCLDHPLPAAFLPYSGVWFVEVTSVDPPCVLLDHISSRGNGLKVINGHSLKSAQRNSSLTPSLTGDPSAGLNNWDQPIREGLELRGEGIFSLGAATCGYDTHFRLALCGMHTSP